jgi:hypothetical protein
LYSFQEFFIFLLLSFSSSFFRRLNKNLNILNTLHFKITVYLQWIFFFSQFFFFPRSRLLDLLLSPNLSQSSLAALMKLFSKKIHTNYTRSVPDSDHQASIHSYSSSLQRLEAQLHTVFSHRLQKALSRSKEALLQKIHTNYTRSVLDSDHQVSIHNYSSSLQRLEAHLQSFHTGCKALSSAPKVSKKFSRLAVSSNLMDSHR